MSSFVVVFGVSLVVVMSQPALGQNGHPRVEIFGGFSYLPADGDDFPRQASRGFQAGISGNVNRWFGIVADFGGQYRTVSDLGPPYSGVVAHTSVYQYLAGPRFTVRTERLDLFAHALIGGATGRSGLNGFSDSGLTLGGGGGVDIRLGEGDRSAIRAQVDVLGSFVDILEDNLRIGIGAVVKLGGS